MYRMKDFGIARKAPFKLAALAVLLGLSATGTAQAVTVFSETFEGYTFPTGAGTGAINEGIPNLTEGAQQSWYAARFQTGSGGNATGTMAQIDQDLAVLTNGGGSNTSNVGRIEDDAGLLFKLNTKGLDSVNLSFNWGTAKTTSSDKLVVGYHIGPISGFNAPGSNACGGNGEAGCFADLRTALPWYTTGTALTGNWAQLLRGNSVVTFGENDDDGPGDGDDDGDDGTNGGWQSASFLLDDAVENQNEVWVAFWLDNGNNDFGLIDNVLVSAVPETDTYAMMLAGLGLIGFTIYRRRTL